MISVIVPAHNEANVIGDSLRCLLDGEGADELEVIVVCNGCTDSTAEMAREFPVQVIELDEASKTAALNAGDGVAGHFPRFYVDADIKVRGSDLVVAAGCLDGPIHAVSPAMAPVLDGRPWAVRAFYRVWTTLPYTQTLIGSGVFGLDAQARGRFASFPPIIADDLYVRLHLGAGERRVVDGTTFALETPRTVTSLIKVKTRAHLGALQLREQRPDLFAREDAAHPEALRRLATHPSWWPDILAYVAIRTTARWRARLQHRKGNHHHWERDETSRESCPR